MMNDDVAGRYGVTGAEGARMQTMCKALANPARFRMLLYMADHPQCITGEIAAFSGLAQATTSQHLAVLRECGLVRGVTEGPATCYCLDPAALTWFGDRVREVVDWLSASCCGPSGPASPYESSTAHSAAPKPAIERWAITKEQGMTTDDNQITEAVRAHYAEIARGVLAGGTKACCGDACCTDSTGASTDRISIDLYAAPELAQIPTEASLASLGCGNPTAIATLLPGEVVLDLGSGGGIDVLLAAARVGPTGFAYGLDMTDEMLALSRRNAEAAGARNVAFLKGDIAAIPLPDASVDVIVSNCVINLAADKAPVFHEAYRVLRPGGRFAVSDVVVHGGLPPTLGDAAKLRQDLASWAGCIAGALSDAEYRAGLEDAGFVEIDLEISRRYAIEDLPAILPEGMGRLDQDLRADVVGRFAATTVRARKAPDS